MLLSKMFIKINSKNQKKDYLQAYEKYVKNPYNQSKIFSFLKTHFDTSSQWTQELYQIWKKKNHHVELSKSYVKLSTSGSTKFIKSNYKWGPNFSYIRDEVHGYHHRFWNFKNKYWINLIKAGKCKFYPKAIKNEGQLFSLNIRDFLFKTDNYSFLANSCWIINPINLNVLIKNKKILDFIKKNEIFISLTETDPSCYDFSILDEYKIPWTNQMRSWKEGTSFYTCPYKKRHWMENLFYCTEDKKIIDLLNFHNNWWMNSDANPDNIWPLEKEFKQCECGTWYREMNFQPHSIKWFYNHLGQSSDYSYKINRSLHQVIEKFDYFQIIQKNDLKTFYLHTNRRPSTKESELIKVFIFNIFENYSYILKMENYLFNSGSGNKQPLFWSEFKNQNQFNPENKEFKRI